MSDMATAVICAGIVLGAVLGLLLVQMLGLL